MATYASRPVRFVIGLTLFLLPLPASAQQLALRWIPSPSAGVSGYRLYVAPAQSGAINVTPINLGNPAPDASGISTGTISLDRTRDWVAEMTAYSSSGAESARSNRISIPAALGESLGSSLHQTDFSGVAVGSSPPGYLDSTAAFRIAGFADGNRAYGTSAASGRVSSRYVGGAVTSAAAYEISGRIWFMAGAGQGGVAVRVPDSRLSQYFALAVDARGAFAVSQQGKAPLTCGGSASTGVSRALGRWYRFRLRATNPSGRARVRATVWPDGTAEPAAWQVDCWTTTTLSLGSGAFALFRDAGGIVLWDDLAVRPVLGTLDPIP